MNEHSDHTVDSKEFIDQISSSCRKGFGFVPLIGSGISAPSGIIMGMEFSSYLAYVVHSVLVGKPKWDLRQNGWPPYPVASEYEESLKWLKEQFRSLCSRNNYAVDFDGYLVTNISPNPPSHSTPAGRIADAINRPLVPTALRSPDYRGDDEQTRLLAGLLHRKEKGLQEYEPLIPSPEDSPTSFRKLLDLAVRSLSDWRLTLHFLSRVIQNPRRREPQLGTPNESVVDRFNTFITSDKRPNLGHKMLVHLARPLRIRTVLTTNFDRLIEEAFHQVDMPLTKFNVSNRGALPDAFLVRDRPSIVKMHGELLETRSDLSLDDDPSIEDCQTFLKYFFDERADVREVETVPCNLLVAGFSASDLRIVRFIQHLLDETSDARKDLQPRVFWICVTDWDVTRVERLFGGPGYEGRVVIHKSVRPDLLLYEMYQKLTLSLPGGGLTYQYIHNIPPNRYGEQRFRTEQYEDFTESLTHCTQSISDTIRVPGSPTPSESRAARDSLSHIVGHQVNDPQSGTHDITEIQNLYKVSTGPDPQSISSSRIQYMDLLCGALEALSIPHSKFLKKMGNQCLWFELADYEDTDSLLHDIVRAITLRIGRFQREQISLTPFKFPFSDRDSKSIPEELKNFFQGVCHVYRISPMQWKIFIYGREPAGSCSGWFSKPWEGKDPQWEYFQQLLEALAAVGFHVVFAPPTEYRKKRDHEKRKVLETLKAKLKENRSISSRIPIFYEWETFFDEEVLNRNEWKIPNRYEQYEMGLGSSLDNMSLFSHQSKGVQEKCDNDREFEKFLYAATLFRQSRHPSALFYEAVQECPNRFNLWGVDNDLVRSQKASAWTDFLRDHWIFYYRPGGFSWMHRDVRLHLRGLIDLNVSRVSKVGGSSYVKFQAQKLARTHFWIGDWYFKAFCTTGHILPILESLYHRFQAARHSVHARPDGLPTARGNSMSLNDYRYTLFRSSILEMIKTLILARPYLKLWVANSGQIAMFAAQSISDMSTELDKVLSKFTLKDNFRKEAEREVKFFISTIRDTCLAIHEEATIDRKEVWIVGSNDRSISKDLHIDLSPLNDKMYRDNWNERGMVKKALNEMFPKNSSSVAFAVDIIKLLFLNVGEQDTEDKYKKSLAEYAKRKAECLRQIEGSRDRLFPLLKLFAEVAYARIRRAKFLYHSTPANLRKDSTRSDDVRKMWLSASRACNLTLDWCKHLPADYLKEEMSLKVRLHCYYAVALANLDRFYEAHRHINEASGLNSKREVSLPGVELAKLRLRRAEVCLTEVHRLRQAFDLICVHLQKLQKKGNGQEGGVSHTSTKEKVDILSLLSQTWMTDLSKSNVRQLSKICIHPSILGICPQEKVCQETAGLFLLDLARLITATLDDAWGRLEYAEAGLSGQSQSNLWWGRLSTMKLRAFSYQVSGDEIETVRMRMLAYRHRHINPQEIWDIFERSYLTNKQSLFRRLRLIRYVCEAFSRCVEFGDGYPFIADKVITDKSAGIDTGLALKSRLNQLDKEIKKNYPGNERKHLTVMHRTATAAYNRLIKQLCKRGFRC